MNVNSMLKKFKFIWLISIIEICVFLGELGRNWTLTGSPIQTKPSFNPMIGPSVYVLINMGARFAPCMQPIKELNDFNSSQFPCPNYTGSIEQESCSLTELCGFSNDLNQWYRWIIPIFLHGGLVHLIVNVSAQLILGISVENKIGSIRLTVIYFLAGIFGNIISGNFSAYDLTTVGCSGSLFGIVALYLLQLIFNWKETTRCQFVCFIIGIVIDFVLGLFPILDNFGHLGGFIMGLYLGIVFVECPFQSHQRVWLVLRIVFLILSILLFVLFLLNIYIWQIRCSWCQYINCLPINDWCENSFSSNLTIFNTTSISK